MAKNFTLSVSDYVFEEINNLMKRTDKNNKSEFVEELIRVGIVKLKFKLGDYDGQKN